MVREKSEDEEYFMAGKMINFSIYIRHSTETQPLVEYVCGCFWLQWQSGAVATETTWPAEPKTFTIWHFTEKTLPIPA